MPTREDIDSFKQKVNLWGDEPAIMEAMGETIEDVLPPEPSLEEELESGELSQDNLSMDEFLSQAGLDVEDETEDMPGLDDLLDEPVESPVPETESPETDDFALPPDMSDFSDLGFDETEESPASPEDSFDDLFGGGEGAGLEGLEDLIGTEDLGGVEEADLEGLEGLGGAEEADLEGLDGLGGVEEADLEGLEDLGGVEEADLEGLEDLGGVGDTGLEGLDGLGGVEEEDLEGLEDLGGVGDTDLEGLEDLGGVEDTGFEGLEDLGGVEDTGFEGLEDLGGAEDAVPESLEDLGGPDISGGLDEMDLGDLDELGSMEDMDLGGLDVPGASEPGASEDLEELEDLGEPEELVGGEEEGFDLNAPGEEFDLSSPDEDIAELGGIDDMSLEDEGVPQFSLGNLSEGFEFQEGISFDDDLDASLDSLDTLDDTFLMDDTDDLEIEETDLFQISDEDMDAVQENLRRLPLNLKIAIQDVLSEADDLTGVRYKKLVTMLIKGSAPRQISTEFFNITGKKIELPKGYQKLTGKEFEKKKTGFLYLFAEKGWPFIRLAAVILVLLGLTVFLSFQYLYRPMQAHMYYVDGLERIADDEYSEADEFFRKAYFGWNLGRLNIKGWPRRGRFLDYASAYEERRAFPWADMMYEGLIGEYPDYINGYYRYGTFLTNRTGDYAKSAEILSLGLNRDLFNYNLTLALGDNYMLWAEEDPDKLEDARYQYATAVSRRENDESMLRMLTYFLKTENDEQIRILNNIYASKTNIKGDSAFTAKVLSDLGGYYIDRNQVSDAKDLLFKAEQINMTVPEVHYQLARYFRRTYNTGQEKVALQKTLFYMDQVQPLNRSRIFKKIAVYRRRGEISMEEGRYDSAEAEFVAGINLLEDSQARGLIGTDPLIGELYGDMGNLHYDVYDDLGAALEYYILAEKNRYFKGEMSYKKGYVYYDKGDYDSAVLEFESALKTLTDRRNTQFALANTLVHRQNLFGARNQYQEILRGLKRDESALPYLAPEDILEHRSLVNNFIRVYNNLAYVDFQLADRSRDPSKESEALLNLTKAADYADRIDRDPETRVRTRPEDSLVFQNTMAILKPLPGTSVYMYDEITRTPDEMLSR